jgi:hypothetical protein
VSVPPTAMILSSFQRGRLMTRIDETAHRLAGGHLEVAPLRLPTADFAGG